MNFSKELEPLQRELQNAALQLGFEKELALPLFAGCLILFLAVTIFAYRALFSQKAQKSVVFTGLTGSGKTSLFFMLRDGSTHSGTVTSMEANEGNFPLLSEQQKNPKARSFHLVDVPGHPRLRSKLDPYLGKLASVVYLVDALDFMPHIRTNAEYLFDLLTNKAIAKRRVPILVACNKMDRVTAHSVEFIRKQLEKEIEKLRVSRLATVDVEDKESTALLAMKDRPFQFTTSSNKVSFIGCSVLNGSLGDIESFIRDSVPS